MSKTLKRNFLLFWNLRCSTHIKFNNRLIKDGIAPSYFPSYLQPHHSIPSITKHVILVLQEVQEYFTDCIVNDNLGIIDNAHTVFADRGPRRAMSKKCINLAKLHSIAVDYPKSGVVAKIRSYLDVRECPDFMEKPDKPTYKSKRVIGKLYRAVKNITSHTSPLNSFTLEVAKQTYDPDMEVDGFKDYVSDAFNYKT
jgi:RNA-dependent RNA polymerase